MTSARYQTAITRNLAELQKLLLIRETLLGLSRHKRTARVFTRVVHEALRNDYISHAIKVFEQGAQCASFWYIYRTDPRIIDKYARRSGYPISDLQAVSDKLKIIRNGTHFHIDRDGVLNPKQIWSVASLTGKQLSAAIDFAWGALSEVQRAAGGAVPELLDYTAEHALAAFQGVEATRP